MNEESSEIWMFLIFLVNPRSVVGIDARNVARESRLDFRFFLVIPANLVPP